MNIWLKIKYNLKYLLLFVVMGSVRVSLFKEKVILAYGHLLGMISFLVKLHQWKAIIFYLRRFYHPAWLYLPLYFTRIMTYKIRHMYLYDDHDYCKEHLSHDGVDGIMQALSEGKGAIIVACHSNASIYGKVLYDSLLPLKILANEGSMFKDEFKHSIGYIMPERVRFIKDHFRFITARGAEKEFVRHVRGGGVAMMYIDIPTSGISGYVHDFLGAPMKFSAFPFRLALRHGIPLFFSFVTEKSGGGYHLSVTPARHYSTPEEGVAKYVSLLQAHIRENPEMWLCSCYYYQWCKDSDRLQ